MSSASGVAGLFAEARRLLGDAGDSQPFDAARHDGSIRDLELALLDPRRLDEAIRLLRAALGGRAESAEDTSMTEEEEEMFHRGGLRLLAQAAPHRFLRLILDPVGLILAREVMLDEMSDHWWRLARDCRGELAGEAATYADPAMAWPATREAERTGRATRGTASSGDARLAMLDRVGLGSRELVVLPGSAVERVHPAEMHASDITLEFGFQPDGSSLVVELIEPPPLPTSRALCRLVDDSAVEVGRYDGPADAISFALGEEVRGAGGLTFHGDVQWADGGRVRFSFPLSD